MVPVGIPPVLNPFDENALELALRLKDEHRETRVTVVSAGRRLPLPVLRKALAAGADELVLLEDGAFEELDPPSTALLLSLALRKLGGFKVILTGRQASDWNWGLTGLMLAEKLGLPAVSLVCGMRVEGERATARRLSPSGLEVVRVPLPALFTVTSEAGELRGVTLTSLREAVKKPVKLWGAKDLGVEISSLRRREAVELKPVEFRRRGERTGYKTSEEAGEKLALKLLEEGAI